MRERVADFWDECTASVRGTFAAHLPLYFCLVLFTAITVTITTLYKAPLDLSGTVFFLEAAPQYFFVGLFFAALVQFYRLARAGSNRPLQDFGGWLYKGALGDRPGHVFHTLMTITPLMVTFNVLKEDLPLIKPFSWDATFAKWDRVLGMGWMPWEWLQPILGHPPITAAISFAYGLWFFLMFGVLIWQAFFAKGSVRMQFLLAFAFSWFFAGNVLAVIFSSAGPCYYGHFYSPDPYAAQLAYLKSAGDHWSVPSSVMQGVLWDSYKQTRGANIGISAMPSMHVTIATLLAILGMKTHKWLGRALTAFAVIIVLGSIHLVWHYAVDAIAGVGLASLFWWCAGALLRWQEGVRAPSWQEAMPGIAAASGAKDS